MNNPFILIDAHALIQQALMHGFLRNAALLVEWTYLDAKLMQRLLDGIMDRILGGDGNMLEMYSRFRRQVPGIEFSNKGSKQGLVVTL